jgi:uncharacterized protein YggE
MAARILKTPLRLSLALLALLAMVVLSACDTQSTPAPPGENPRQVTVVGSGEVQGTPDTLTANVGISNLTTDITASMNQTNERQQAVIDALVNAGVGRRDIATTNVTLQPQYTTDGVTVTGYLASNTVDVTIRDVASAGRVLALIVSTGGGATRINAVNYTINDDSQLIKDARTRAFDDAKDRAQQFAELSGLKLGKVISISEVSSGGGPTPTPAPRALAADVPVSPGQQTVGLSVTVVWELG